MYKVLGNLIKKKFYENREDIEMKVDVFYAMSKLTEEEYADLTMQINEVYPEPVIEPDTEEAAVE